MIKYSEIKFWLNYWQTTLADVDRKKIDVTTHPILVESYFIDKVPKRHAKFLWDTSQTNKETEFIIVDISPCSIKPKFKHGKPKQKGEEAIYPFWIPAVMYKDGTLAPQKGNNKLSKSFFVREYLTPNPKGVYSIASIKDVDKALRKVHFKKEIWDTYWQKCESFFTLVTGKNFEEFNAPQEPQIYIQRGELRGLTENIRRLYNQIEETSPTAGLFYNLIDNKGVNFISIPDKPTIVRNKKHIGQMSGEFPLSVSQRESIDCLTRLENSNILAVNGPPGTGKTTFLQSVVANSVVSSVVNDQKPELIVACSANNQAITNILDSFVLSAEDKLTKRWLPGLSSLGLYLSSNQDSKYQTCSSQFGDGFLNDYENEKVEDKREFFLKAFEDNIKACASVDECKSELYTIVLQKVDLIVQHINIAERYENIDSLLKNAGFSTMDDLRHNISTIENKIEKLNLEIEQIYVAEKELKRANQQRSLHEKLFHFLTKHKIRRASQYERVLLNIDLRVNVEYSNFNDLIHLINRVIISKSESIKQLNQKRAQLIELKEGVKNSISLYHSCINEWNSRYGGVATSLYDKTGNEYRDLLPLEDMQVKMDISYRYEAFWHAIHFREAEYLLYLETNQENNNNDKGRSKYSYKEKLQRFAGITPIYISTFHSLPRYATYYDFEEGEKAYYDLFDLLIVDEAGQVAPDIAIPSFSLAKKAVVVGDIYQIEPVWSVEERLDMVNLKMNKLITKNTSDEAVVNLISSGLLCSSGNLMKIAQRACFVQDGEDGGTLLKEHRRCPDKIISFSNEYVYKNKLVLTKGNMRKAKTELPLKGFMHIESMSERVGTSRQNIQDAYIIAKWINNNRAKIEDSFGNKPIANILAVVTPYKSQALLIKKELLKFDRETYKRVISGTVHALQGAEIDIVIFSTVITPGDSTFFANNLNVLNVAVSRAKSSFLLFGNLNALDPTKRSPLGYLKKWIQEDEDCELSNKIVFDNKITNNEVTRINDLNTHTRILERAFEFAKKELIIVSPFISSNAIECDIIKTYDNKRKLETVKINPINKLIFDTVKRGVKVFVVTDSTLDMSNNKLKPTAKKGRKLIEQNGAALKLVDGIHSKTIIIDDDIIIEGSFNWFSALRDEQSKYYRDESSIVVQGEPAKSMIKNAKLYLENTLK